jgi:anti-sigma factor RsiW
MSCGEKFETISAYLDGELKGAELEAFRGHLSGCAECRRELAEQERIWGLLGELETAEPMPGLTGRILDRTAGRRSGTGPLVRSLRWITPLAAAATLLVAALIWNGVGTTSKLDPDTIAVIEKLDVLEHLDVLESMDLLQAAEKEPILIEDPDTAATVMEEGS